MTCVTGVSGSGKSTLVIDTLYRALARQARAAAARSRARTTSSTGWQLVDKVIEINQAPIGRSPRSNPATYTGLFGPIRELFAQLPEARARGYGPGRFSFNVKGGRCEACAGDGVIAIEMHFLPDVFVTCEVCGGRRYDRETLEVQFKGLSIADVLDLTVAEALEVLGNVPAGPQPPRRAARGRARLPPPRPAGHDAVGRRGAAGEAGPRARPPGDRPHPLRPRRAHDRPALRRRPAAPRRARPAGRRRQHGAPDRAQPRRHQEPPTTWSTSAPRAATRGGRMVAAGTPEEIAACPASYTGQFLRRVRPRRPSLAAGRLWRDAGRPYRS